MRVLGERVHIGCIYHDPSPPPHHSSPLIHLILGKCDTNTRENKKKYTATNIAINRNTLETQIDSPPLHNIHLILSSELLWLRSNEVEIGENVVMSDFGFS